MMDKEITEWDPFRVLAQDLHYGEFEHRVPIDYTLSPGKDKEQYRTKMKPLNGIISAYINTCGGCVELQNAPNPTDLVQAQPFDKWRNNIAEQFNFVLPDSLRDNIKLEYNKGRPYVQVHPCANSSLLVSLDTHLYTRQNASKKYLGLQESVTKYMNQAKKAHKELQTKPVYSYEEKLPYGEDDHIEFKHFASACSAEALLAIINGHDKSTVGLSLFGMANLMGGGTVFIGADDDGKVIGQPLSESEEEEFREGMLKFYREDVSGMKRYCDNQEFDPVEGRHFSINLIPVEGSAIPKFHCKRRCKECPNKRRVLIKISVFQSNGILLMQHPECYKVRDNGKIVRLSIDEWYQTHREAKPATSHHQRRSGKMKPSKSIGTPKGHLPNKPSASDTRQRKESVDHGNIHAYKSLSFRQNSSQCNPRQAEQITPESIARGAEDCEILKLRHPCNFHPSCDALLLRYPSLKEKLDIIKKEIGEKGSFALVDCSLFSCFRHDIEASDIPPGSPLKSPAIKPGHHLIDIFAVDDARAKHIFCLFEENGTHHDQEKSYGLQLVRVLKKRLTEVLKKQGKGSEVCIKLTILRMESDDLEIFQSSHLSVADNAPDYVEMEMMKIAVASTFLAKESVFKDKMGKDMTVLFSLEQAGLLVGSIDMYAPVTIITGSPGTGKTLIAQCLCQKFGKENSIYLCSTKPLEEFVKFVGKAETFLLTPDMDRNLCQVIQDLLDRDICYIVIDETHMIKCEVVIWKEIFDLFHYNTADNPEGCLFIFRDSQYHDYQNVQASSQLTAAIKSYKEEHPYGVIHENVLTANFRNSQVVGSYMHAIQPEPQEHIKFKGTTVGDDVTVLVVPNLRVKSDENGLLLHVKEKIKTTDPNDIAILVGWSTDEKVQEDSDLFSSVFTEHKIKVQGAGIFPPDGMALDTVWNFTGLDRDVIMHITPVGKDAKDMLQNNKYTTAVVSRGINRVELLQDEVVSHEEALKRNFDQLPTDGDTVIKSNPPSTPKKSEESPTPSAPKESQATDKPAAGNLLDAAEAGDVNRVSALLEQGADINAVSVGATALGRAAASGELEKVKLLLSQGADTGRGELKPLTLAARPGHIDIIQCLLQHGADINAEDDYGYTALGMAAMSGQLEVVKLLLSQGADREQGRWKLLSLAALNGQIDTVQWLLQHGADINAEDGHSNTALGMAALSGQLEVVKLLLSQGADIEQGREKPLPAAAVNSHIDTVLCLLQHGADINAENVHGLTALGEAAGSGRPEMVRLLLYHGADIEGGERKPLARAADHGRIDTVQWLLQHGADINAVSEGYTSLGRAAERGKLDVVKLLLSQGADTERGRLKPLSLAAEKGRRDTVQCLLQHGTSQEAKNQALTEALKVSQDISEDWSDERKAGLKQAIEILRSHGAVG